MRRETWLMFIYWPILLQKSVLKVVCGVRGF